MANLQRGRLAAWIAILAILLNTFAPAVSHAIGAAGSGPWTEICSASGSIAPFAERRTGDAPAKPASAAFQHCPYCASHGASFEAPPAWSMLPAPAEAAPQVAASANPVEPARPVWRVARSRAPPVV